MTKEFYEKNGLFAIDENNQEQTIDFSKGSEHIASMGAGSSMLGKRLGFKEEFLGQDNMPIAKTKINLGNGDKTVEPTYNLWSNYQKLGFESGEKNYMPNVFYNNTPVKTSILGESRSMSKFTTIKKNDKINTMQNNNKNLIAYSSGSSLMGAYPNDDDDYMTVDGISYKTRERILQKDKTYSNMQKFFGDSSKAVVDKFKFQANKTLDYLKRTPETFGRFYKENESIITLATGAEVGSLTGIKATYIGNAYLGKVIFNIGTLARISGESCYQLAISTESGINKTMHISGSLLAEFLGKGINIGGRFKDQWKDAERLKQYGKTQSDVDIIATILRGIEGTTYSELKNAIIDTHDGNLEKFIQQSKEVYEW